jgi:hypothetical protein
MNQHTKQTSRSAGAIPRFLEVAKSLAVPMKDEPAI